MPLTETISALGYSDTLRLANNAVEVLVTASVGPRVLSYRVPGGPNVLRVFEKQAGGRGESTFQVRGGHRLWVSPENKLTYVPDNDPVMVEHLTPGAVRLTNAPKDAAPVRKSLTLTLDAKTTALRLEHEVTNASQEPMRIASWGITVMTPGGFNLIPQPPLGEHGKEFLPNRVVVPWTYTDFSDPRWRFGTRFWQLHPDPKAPSTKMGFALPSGHVAYVMPGALFVKSFTREAGVEYPDLGCNYETFSKGDFIELETLGPLRTLAPGESTRHTETWHLFGGDTPPPPALDDATVAGWLQPLLAQLPMPR